MPITRFYHYIIRFADATSPLIISAPGVERYVLEQAADQGWSLHENDAPVVLLPEDEAQLGRLTAALYPLPPETDTQHEILIADGNRSTMIVLRGNTAHTSFWVGGLTDPTWSASAALITAIHAIAERPRAALAAQHNALTQRLFAALSARDAAAIAACYHPEATYRNTFVHARGAQIGDVWLRVFAAVPDVTVECNDIRGGHEHGVAYWRAVYTYPPTHRRITHELTAQVRYVDGLIYTHEDRFNFHAWAHAAYGPLGGALGGTRVFQWAVTRRVRTCLLG